MLHPKGWANGRTFSDERERARAAEDLSQSEAWRAAAEGSSCTLPVGLSLSATSLSALLQARRSRFGTSEPGATIESSLCNGVQSGGTGSLSRALCGLRPHTGGGEADARWFGRRP